MKYMAYLTKGEIQAVIKLLLQLVKLLHIVVNVQHTNP